MMRELRLIGVHDDGEHLVVTDDAGEEYRLRIDDRLRAAARRDRPRLGQLEVAQGEDVRPKDVQAMIRAGATPDEVAARTGWDVAKIARFEGPVLAEREHVAARAQAVRMRGTNQAGAPETLAQRAANRFATRGVEASTVVWDACRDGEGQWTVTAVFVAGGRDRTATWWFDQAGMSVVAKNDEAKWLSEADTPAGPVPAGVHRPTAVFDVEVEEERVERSHRAQPDDLINSMREHSGAKNRGRSGRRRGRQAAPARPEEDALPFETDQDLPPAARGTHPEDAAREADVADEPTQSDPAESGQDAGRQSPAATGGDTEDEPPTLEMPVRRRDAARDEPADSAAEDTPEDSRTGHVGGPDESADDEDRAGGSTEPEVAGTRDADDGPDTDGADESATSDDDATSGGRRTKASGKGKGRNRRGRASVPSWDDVMFGSKRD